MEEKKQDVKEALKAKFAEKIDEMDVTELEDMDLEDVDGGCNNNCFCFEV